MKKSTKKVIGVLGLSLLISSTAFAQTGGKGERPQGPPSVKQILKDLDANEDGKISLKEAKGPLRKDFKKIDTNEDGFISKEELGKGPRPKRR